MQIIIRNNAALPNKTLRFIKWKIYQAKLKFDQLIYAEIFINTEGQSPKLYLANIRLGIPGNDIIIQSKSENLSELFQKSIHAMHRYLAKHKVKTTRKRNQTVA